jgi:hypothetical protein
VPIGVDEEPFPTHPHTPWRLFLSRPARAPIVEMLYRTLRIEVNFDSITVERTSQWVRATKFRMVPTGQGWTVHSRQGAPLWWRQ